MSEKIMKIIILSLTGIGAILAAVLAFMSYTGKLDFGTPLDFVVLIVLIVSGPYPFYEQGRLKKIERIEERLSDFLRDLAVSNRFGMTLADSIRKASSGNYGKLTPDIKKMATQIDWGVPATDAMEMFAERVGTPLVKRAMAIVVKATGAGGDVSDVLNATAKNIKDIQLINIGRKMEMGSYKAVIFTAFFVFLAVVVIMNSCFLPAIEASGGGGIGAEGVEGAATQQAGMSVEDVKFIYLGAALVQGFGDGILVGLIETGKIVNGFRNSFIMVLLAYLILCVVPI
ncbi:MAG: type II secretion protein F [Euryarchaeota archaeon CG_4_9_14_3_um_filter_38_12]|nr:MAG: type II secretion protein F [Euryarchaeota archaeon CG_4_9_14_3_um_filter_38_12]